MPDIAPCLWFDKNGEEAARFYVDLFPNSSIDKVQRSPTDYPNGKAGDVLIVEFTLLGRPFQALNGGPNFTFDEAVSMSLPCADQAEVDHYWDALIADGGSPVVCGWLKDKYGLSWQVFPEALPRLMASDDAAAAARVMQAMMQMVKIDLATIERAYAGEAA